MKIKVFKQSFHHVNRNTNIIYRNKVSNISLYTAEKDFQPLSDKNIKDGGKSQHER